MNRYVHRFWVEDDGQDLIEYSLLIVIFVFTAFAIVGTGTDSIHAIWNKVNGHLTAANTSAAGN